MRRTAMVRVEEHFGARVEVSGDEVYNVTVRDDRVTFDVPRTMLEDGEEHHFFVQMDGSRLYVGTSEGVSDERFEAYRDWIQKNQ